MAGATIGDIDVVAAAAAAAADVDDEIRIWFLEKIHLYV